MMRSNIVKAIFLSAFILCCAVPALSLSLIETQSVCVLPLPPVWGVVSKDDAPEQNFAAGRNLQQAIYARAESADGQDAVLQIFLIWSSDEGENIEPIPSDLIGASIGARYGNVSVLGEDIVDTVLGSLPVITYGTVLFLADDDVSEFRYKRASLYQRDRQVLVLLRYRPEFEDYWHEHFEAMLNEWVGSLTFALRRALVTTLVPEIILPTPRLPAPSELPPVETAVTPLPEQQPDVAAPDFDWLNWAGLLLGALVIILAARIIVVRRRLKAAQETHEMQNVQEVRRMQEIQEVREIRAAQEIPEELEEPEAQEISEELEEPEAEETPEELEKPEAEEAPEELEEPEAQEIPEELEEPEAEETPEELEGPEAEETPEELEEPEAEETPEELEEPGAQEIPEELEEPEAEETPEELEEPEAQEIPEKLEAEPPSAPAPENNNIAPVWLPTFEEWLAEERLTPKNTNVIHDLTGEKGFDKVQTLLGEVLGNLKDTEKPEE